jgi:predicted lactoylglutathione lyase|tara:strand:+ start:13161 stop:13529 length:369 start_codon:yes stop_codon:yes gene_type:complete
MLAYTTIGTADIEKAKAFYLAVLEDMDVSVVMDIGRLAALGTPSGGAMLAVCTPYNEEGASPGNGNMVSIAPGSKELVEKLHAKALELGATDDGAPGDRMDGFYGAYFRDADGNKVCFCHFG